MMLSRMTLTLALLALLVSTSQAQSAKMQGNWSVKGTNPAGEAYEGQLKIKPINVPLYQLTWDVKYENRDKRQTFPGTALIDQKSDKMYAAYGINTLRYGLIYYPLNEEDGLEGSATWTSHNGVGAELLGGEFGGDKIAGTYQVVGRRSPSDVDQGAAETYDGTLIVRKPKEGRYKLEWYLGDGMPYEGFAYKTDKALIGVWGIGGSYGLEIYELADNRKSAEAKWYTPIFKDTPGTEQIRKQ